MKTIYKCLFCNYETKKKFNLDRHNLSHKEEINSPKFEFTCICGKSYKHKSSLSRHEKFCKKIPNHNIKISVDDVTSDEIRKQFIEYKCKAELYDKQCDEIDSIKGLLDNITTNSKSTTINNYNTTHTTINNLNVNNLNINFILKDKCNDALSIHDFINQLKLTVDDLQYTKKNGYVKGVSNVFIKNLNQLKPEKRPIKCSDKRGKNIYVKNCNEWEKDSSGEILDDKISLVSQKQVQVLTDLNDGAQDNSMNSISNVYMHLIMNTIGGVTNIEREKNNKIIQKNIGKHCNINDINIDK